MSKVEQIKAEIETLTLAERAEIFIFLRDHPDEFVRGASLPSPDITARRRAIFGGRVYPNAVLRAREEELK